MRYHAQHDGHTSKTGRRARRGYKIAPRTTTAARQVNDIHNLVAAVVLVILTIGSRITAAPLLTILEDLFCYKYYAGDGAGNISSLR